MTVEDSALERRLERLGLSGNEDYWTARYLLCNHLIEPMTAESRQKFEAASRFLRDLVAHRWVKTRHAREEATPKRIHYLSMEFLLGRTLRNNMMNLAVHGRSCDPGDVWRSAQRHVRVAWLGVEVERRPAGPRST